MNNTIRIELAANEEVFKRLNQLQVHFAHACNFIAPIAQKSHCWNRVALHHLSYHAVRKTFPDLGSQMACNAIYSVCRSYRLLLNHPQSPFVGKKIAEGQLPHISFLERSPVFFDRHTLSLQNNVLSLFTLEGRLRFGIGLSEADELIFRNQKLREIQLHCIGPTYCLTMVFGDERVVSNAGDDVNPWPDYFVLKDLPGTLNALDVQSSNTSFEVRQAS
jgi:hypothetical protein